MNSESEFQDKCRTFADREIFVCQSMLIEELFKKGIFSIDDVENLYAKVEGSEEEEPQEILEWWIVSNHLANRFRELGEPILENDFGIWWGRTCSGQAIMLDGIIRKMVQGFSE